MRASHFASTLLLAAAACASPARAQVSLVHPVDKFCWGENVGYFNWRDAGAPPSPGAQGARVHTSFLSGFVWGENVGWVNLGDGTPGATGPGGPRYANIEGTDSGINIDDATGNLFGLAWGENIGWVNFDTRAALGPFGQQARLDRPARRFRGYAWAPNIGWINLDDASKFVGLDCAADFNCSGIVSVQDIFDFLAAYFAGCDGSTTTPPCTCHSADINGVGGITVQDIFDFLAAYFGGCG